jgi:hypothetical protein
MLTFFNIPVIISILFAILAMLFFITTIRALREKAFFGSAMKCVIALLMLSLSVLFGTISIAIQGYHAFTREDLAAVVKIEPAGIQQFTARFYLSDGSEKTYTLSGDQLYVDAHILKWKPIANIFGLHTAYELDRVAGRYVTLIDEKNRTRTVYSLSKDKSLDMFDLRRKFEILNPLVDAEYGSATFTDLGKADEFKIMVSTSGLLIRKAGEEAR